MRGLFGSFVLAATLLAAAWANHHHHGHDHHHDHHQHHHDHHGHAHHDHAHHSHAHHDHHDHTEAEMSCRRLAPHNADFAFALYKNLKAKTPAGSNIFFSPLGISTALSMLSTGATSDTHSQLFSTLGYSALTRTEVDESYEHLFHMLGHSQEDQLLNVGNAAAVRTGFTPKETFLNDTKKFYSGDILCTDFANPSEAAAQINTYIAGKTNDKITDLVKDLDPATALVLINYVLFRGQWEKPFNADQTTKEEFNVDENTKVQVDMMHRTGRYDYYEDAEDHVTVVLLPYKGNTSMMVVLPDEGKMDEVEGIICRNHLKSWHDKVMRNSVELSLPKFSISAKASLDSTLTELGIIRAFTDSAEFSGISKDVPLKVSKVAHQAVLSVDETGTEAAAATTIEIMPMSMPNTIKLNRPFLVFIVEHSTKSILFMGKIINPTI